MAGYSLTVALRAKCAAIWRRESEHPFVRGLGDGTLPADRFSFYLEQDYLFLIDYSRVFALASAKARDLATMRLFAELLGGTLKVECSCIGTTASDSASRVQRSNVPAP